LYFLAKGDCIASVLTETKQKEICGTLSAGNFFGEIALITNGRRTATVTSKNYCTIGGLP
jgi:CRP-like cAMP-binding protein